jgi:hypothetical protein
MRQQAKPAGPLAGIQGTHMQGKETKIYRGGPSEAAAGAVLGACLAQAPGCGLSGTKKQQPGHAHAGNNSRKHIYGDGPSEGAAGAVLSACFA